MWDQRVKTAKSIQQLHIFLLGKMITIPMFANGVRSHTAESMTDGGSLSGGALISQKCRPQLGKTNH